MTTLAGRNLEYLLFDYYASMKSFVKIQTLNLGGFSAPGGGSGGPPGGFAGQLIQTRVAYDESELSSATTPISGRSLLDNLNHIRNRITVLESIPSGVAIQENNILVSSGITVLNFDNNFDISLNSPSKITVTLSSSGIFKFGNTTSSDYTQFDNTGHQTMSGYARPWRDELGELLGKKTKGVRISENTTEGTLDFSDTCQIADDYVITLVQFNHDWDTSTTIKPHLHWFQSSSGIPNWILSYRWQVQNQAKTTSWTNLKYSTNAFTYASGTLNQITGWSIVPPAGLALSDILQVRLSRDTDNDSGLFDGLDPVTGTVSALMFDIHMQINSLGSTDEYSK